MPAWCIVPAGEKLHLQALGQAGGDGAHRPPGLEIELAPGDLVELTGAQVRALT
jgi:hypothetical protein